MSKFGFYGCGNIGQVILHNVIEQRICSGGEIFVVDRSAEKLAILNKEFGVKTSVDSETLHDCKYILLAFKPQNIKDITPFPPNKDQVIISILAGTKVESIEPVFPNTKIVRAMPNIPLQFGEGITGLYFPSETDFSVEEKIFVSSVFDSGGKVVEFKNESYMDSFTTLCGSGPAYFLYMAEQFSRIAQENGYTDKQANTMMQQTLIGAAEMIKKSDLTMEELRKQITSAGGVTEAAISVFENKYPEVFDGVFEAGTKQSKGLR